MAHCYLDTFHKMGKKEFRVRIGGTVKEVVKKSETEEMRQDAIELMAILTSAKANLKVLRAHINRALLRPETGDQEILDQYDMHGIGFFMDDLREIMDLATRDDLRENIINSVVGIHTIVKIMPINLWQKSFGNAYTLGLDLHVCKDGGQVRWANILFYGNKDGSTDGTPTPTLPHIHGPLGSDDGYFANPAAQSPPLPALPQAPANPPVLALPPNPAPIVQSPNSSEDEG